MAFYHKDLKYHDDITEKREISPKLIDEIESYRGDIFANEIIDLINHMAQKDIEIKIHMHSDIEPPKMIDGGDWIDLRAAEDVFIPQGEYRLISLGVSMQLPDGYEAHVVPRSSTFKNYGIIQTNHMGVIDNSYCGDNDIWHFPALCLIGKDIVNGSVGTMIHKNDRICQFRIMKKQPDVAFLQVDKLGNKDRGGIGSTGRR